MQASKALQDLAVPMARAASEVRRAFLEAAERSAPAVLKACLEIQALRDSLARSAPPDRKALPAYREPKEMLALRAHLERQGRRA